MTVINTNTASINAQLNLSKANKDMETSMAQLSSGKRINSAADDAAGLSIATRMESQVRGLQMTVRNANDGMSLVSSVEGTLQESTNILQRMHELSVQASNSTYNDTDRAALQDEMSQLQTELDRIANDTEFNGQKVVDGSFTGKSLNVGMNTGGDIAINIGDHSSSGLSANGEKDATMTLMNSVSNIAIGAADQSASATTVKAAVVKADTQGISNTMTQSNVGFDNSQKVEVTTVTENLSVSTTAAMTITVDTGSTADDTTDDAGAGSDNAAVANRAAGVNYNNAGSINLEQSTAASDGVQQVQSFVLDDLTFQTGDVLSATVDGTAVTHTVAYTDFTGNDATANNLAVAEAFVNKFNAAAFADRVSGTANDAGLLTASVGQNADGELSISFTAANASANAFDAQFTATKFTADATATATDSAGAADGTSAATNTVTLSGTYEEGDTITFATSDAFDATGFAYTVKATDLAASDSETYANITANVISEFNAASDDVRFSASNGHYTASATTDTAEIKFTGSEIASGTTNTLTATAGDRTAFGAAAAAAVASLEVTADTIRNGTVVGDFAAGQAKTAQTSVVEFVDADIEVGDIITLNVGDEELTHEVTTATGTAVAAAFMALINDPNGTGSANLSLSGAGSLTASVSSGELSIAGTNKGADAAFDVSLSNQNAAAVSQVDVAALDITVIHEGATFKFGTSADNMIEVTATKEMAALALADAEEAVRDAIVAKSDQLLGITLEAFGTTGNQIKITSDEPGKSFSIHTTAADLVEQGESRAQVDKVTISGLVERGDAFTLTDGTASQAVTVGAGADYDLGLGGGGDIENLESNEDRINAVVDSLIYKFNQNSSTSTASRGEALGEILLTGATAGTAITSTTSAATNNSAVTPAVAQENVIALSGDVEEGDVYNIELNNGSAVSYTVTADDAAGGAAALQASIVTAASDSLTGVTATADSNGGVKLTSNQAGVAFEVTAYATNASDVAQVEEVAFDNVEVGDTFNVSIGGDSVSYTAVEGDDGASVAASFAANASFAGKSLSVTDGKLNIQGPGGEAFTVATSTSNFAGGIQSDQIEITGTVETSDVYSVAINDVQVSYAVQDSDSEMSDVVTNLAAAINSSSVSAHATASVNDEGKLVLTSTQSGGGYSVDVQVSDVGRSRNSVAAIDISTEEGAAAAKAVIQGAISQVNETRSELGAISNRLDHTINNLGNVIVNTEASQSRIEDADFAKVTGELTKSQIMSQAATAMLAQANASKQGVLSLLQG